MSGNKCFYFEEHEFIDLLLDKLEKKRAYAAYLEKEGSVLAPKMLEKDNMFRVRNADNWQQE